MATEKAAGYAAAMREDESEDMKNGIWNSILSSFFPYPDFLVIPDWSLGAGKIDLAVMSMFDKAVVLLYKGKKQGGDLKEMASALDQAARELPVLHGRAARLVADGPKFSLTDCNKSDIRVFDPKGSEPEIDGGRNLELIQSTLSQIASSMCCSSQGLIHTSENDQRHS